MNTALLVTWETVAALLVLRLLPAGYVPRPTRPHHQPTAYAEAYAYWKADKAAQLARRHRPPPQHAAAQ